jgi:hypothetical protein
MLASASKKRIPRYPVAVAVPTLEPTALDVAATGNVREQEDKKATIDSTTAETKIFSFIIKNS